MKYDGRNENTETAGAENTVSDPAAELQNMSFEDALAKLESIVRELESGRIKLDDAVAAYEKAVALKSFVPTGLPPPP